MDAIATEHVPFGFVVEGPAVSKQARKKERREEWKKKVKAAARERWNAEPLPASSLIALTITYFTKVVPGEQRDHGEALDVDNLAKPIMDAMKGVVYCDDKQVSDLHCRIVDFETRSPNLPTCLTEYLRKRTKVVHVSVDPVPSTVAF